jgi:hypothetical protein
MLTALILLSLSQAPSPFFPVAPLSHACESAAVERPELQLPAPEWSFVVRPERACEPSEGVAALMYALGIDAAVPVESSEVEADIYQEEMP